jgi:hypothetical protein
MSKKTTPPSRTVTVHPITSSRIKTLSGQAERAPSTLNNAQIRSLGASVQRHIEPRGGKVK